MKKERMIKKVAVFAMISLLILGLVSCGKDGKDGKPYLKINWDGVILRYTDDLSGTPDPVVKDVYYECEAGTYHVEYIHRDNDDVLWKGTLTMEKGEDGGDGGLFSKGDDGDDIFYELYLYSYIGPQFYDYGTLRLKQTEGGAAGRDGKTVQRIVRDGWIITLEVESQEINN